MKLQKIKELRKGMVAFAEKQRLMVNITKVKDGEVRFSVMNGLWNGTIKADGTASHMHGAFDITVSDFKQVLSVTPEEFSDWYMENGTGTSALIARNDGIENAPEEIPYENGSDPVHEVRIMVTVMGQAETSAELTSWISSMSLSAIEEQIDTGDLIGQTRVIHSETLPEDQVGSRLKDLGNDGRFFNLDEPETDYNPDAKKSDPAGRVLNTQIAQGWSNPTMEMLGRRFIEGMGMSDIFATFIEQQARDENEMTVDDEEPGL
ncbi:hypothetical protein [Pseudosulfitobacter pseudonitzschiae]|uniref:hypothetical protein n=1 Tax=Pseudosulfitobacter pseudonitzschiae TaxID=1402135 RepID=UPI003B75D64D